MDDLTGLAAVVLIFGTPLLICCGAIMAWVATSRAKQGERERTRQAYERLMAGKLEVLRTALLMGYDKTELRELDRRLEQLIGAEAMQMLAQGEIPRLPVEAELPSDAALMAEVGEHRQAKAPQAQ